MAISLKDSTAEVSALNRLLHSIKLLLIFRIRKAVQNLLCLYHTLLLFETVGNI